MITIFRALENFAGRVLAIVALLFLAVAVLELAVGTRPQTFNSATIDYKQGKDTMLTRAAVDVFLTPTAEIEDFLVCTVARTQVPGSEPTYFIGLPILGKFVLL